MRKVYPTLEWLRYYLLLSFLSIGLTALAQHKVVTGRITDSKNGSAISNVSVIANGTRLGTQTNAKGYFHVAVPLSVTSLTLSAVGFLSRNIDVSTTNNIEVALEAISSTLDEILLVGYGTAQRKDITGAVDRVTASDFNNGVMTNPLQQVQGKVAGLVIVQPGGDPNGEFTVRLRGATSLEGQPPLLVIDGIAIDDFQKALTSLNPADVESFDILKDASAAAIYGARGANGVILVTTKKGRTGKISADYNGYAGMEKTGHRLDLLSGDEWRQATAGMNAGSLDAGGNSDWQKLISQTAFSHSHSIGISGGTDQLNIRGSVGYTNQQGIILNTGRKVITSRINAIQKSLKNKLEIRYGINTSTIRRDFLPEQTSTDLSRFGGDYIFAASEKDFLPVWPAYNPDGSYYQPPTNAINPLFILEEYYSKRRENFFQGSLKADYELFKGMRLGMLGALSRGDEVYDKFRPSLPGTNGLAEASKANHNKQNFSGDIHGNFHKSFDKHLFDFTGVYEYNKYLNDGFGVTARGFLVPELLNNNLGTATNVQTNDLFSYKNEVKLISILGRVVYNYDDRYIFTATFRRDGSSKFGANHRWGNFPSVALAWRLNNESVLKDVKLLDNLKLRLSYGLTGNQENLPTDTYRLLYGPAGPYLYNGQFYQSYAVTQENNPDLKWEVRKSFNVGIDFSVFKNRLSGTIDVFNDHTDDMLFLYDIPQPPFLTNKVYANAASAVNRGVEISVNGVIISSRKISWEVDINTATLRNRITKLLGKFKGVDLSLYDPNYGYAFSGGFGTTAVTRLSIGHPAGVFWIPRHAGIDAGGHELYNNYDAAGKFIGTSANFTDQDKVFIDPTPGLTWGLTNKVSYLNFDLDLLLRGVQGQKIFANAILALESIQYLPGSNVVKKSLKNGLADLPQASSYWLQNGSYARLENITIGYTVKKLNGISGLRFYLTATNPFVITKYEGVDPEIRTEGNERYIDFLYYPKSRGLIAGVNVEF